MANNAELVEVEAHIAELLAALLSLLQHHASMRNAAIAADQTTTATRLSNRVAAAQAIINALPVEQLEILDSLGLRP